MKKRYLILTSLLTAGVIGAAGVGLVSAQSSPSNNSLVNAIAQHFNLSPASVQQVVDQYRDQRLQDRQTKFQAKLDQDVKNGTLTQNQENLILDKMNADKQFWQSLKGKTPAERRAALKGKRAELKAWAQANNIPLNILWQALSIGRREGLSGQ